MAPATDLIWPFEGRKAWAQSVYLPRGASQGLQRSVHRSQLQPASSPILRLLVKSQGTDDPSIELWFASLADTDQNRNTQIPNHLGFKFSAFDTDILDSNYKDRIPVQILPQRDINLDAIGPIPSGPTNFTDELYDLSWQDHPVSTSDTKRIVTISWKTKSHVSFNLSRIAGINPALELAVANKVGRIASIGEGIEQEISVDVRWFLALEYQYRNLLESPRGLMKYWRYRILRNATAGSVPVDLCTRLLPRDSEMFYEMEALREADWGTKRTKPISAIDDIDFKTANLRSKRSFMSSAEAEFYLKGAFLYEEHFVSELRIAHLDTLAREDQYNTY
ncbi:uncharacterized protein PAC_14410 [Phialocephala subalpina]|uniref:Uncharacterized protein n=1 Tax=Phialocephala subalpina TaxID=576137 RepID=A0A1L7XHK6_9HELO|nr:uncharacterized protein PAC_14410 [Phialocephala subalpina]